MKRIRNIHPGEILSEEFLTPMGISAYRLAKETGMPQTRIGDIIHGKRSISADTALRLARFFGVSPQFWLGLQNDYDLEEQKKNLRNDLERMSTYEQFMVAQ
ncbi:MAG: HigA family addiction module antidote protein [Spirochaetales bacterium]|nr:HigA family addiction module antidote protein [Spirochaetales bacterium]MBE7439194.1 HigA family addiction module antidote protein [Spirochaetales bacterium]